LIEGGMDEGEARARLLDESECAPDMEGVEFVPGPRLCLQRRPAAVADADEVLRCGVRSWLLRGDAVMTLDEHTILIVEDDVGIRNVMVAILQEEFAINPSIAGTGAEAVRMADEHCPSVIVLDLGLPDMDGEEVNLFVRGLCDRGTYVLVCSAAGAKAQTRAEHMGAHGFLAKPFELDAFIDAVQRGLAPRAKA
jgi:CheY-like chemotaxis protein